MTPPTTIADALTLLAHVVIRDLHVVPTRVDVYAQGSEKPVMSIPLDAYLVQMLRESGRKET